MDDAEKKNLVKDEYLYLQKVVEDFDGRVITFKAWSVTFSLVALGGAFATHAALAFLLGSFSAFLFWILEGYWKTFQLAYYARIEEIEDYFAGDRDGIVPMQISRSWLAAFRNVDKRPLLRLSDKDRRIWSKANIKGKWLLLRSKNEVPVPTKNKHLTKEKHRIHFPVLLWTQVFLLHAFVVLAGLLLYVLYLVKVIQV